MTLSKFPPCFICGKHFEHIGSENQPSGGIEFTSYGHYGTTVFDPMDGTRAIINLCDRCLKEGMGRGDVIYSRVEWDNEFPKGHKTVYYTGSWFDRTIEKIKR